ncbi:MAG: TIGR03960 family B12-binding radical SAM protein [Dehalococcoidales bacterium]|nr:TIGR03960 family B12-binding radical SAM protein [Dehalococcoidales bacterium]
MTNLDNILCQVVKPARYTGGEWNAVTKDWDQTPVRLVLSYPDLYELGVSTIAIPILYELVNDQPDMLAERVFAPWPDMAGHLRESGIPLFSLESKRPLKDFDIIGFSLGYELTYTNVLNILHLARIPLLAAERDESQPLVIAGGSCALNPEPMADFIDCFVIGDGEEVTLELASEFRDWKRSGAPKEELKRRLAKLAGVYVPSLYRVAYGADGLFQSITPTAAEASPRIKRRIVTELPPPPTHLVVPYIKAIHDRGAIEIQRGCSRGCRFCQAGSTDRPVRERHPEEVLKAVGDILANCGYNEISLVSLSTSDYPGISELVAGLFQRYQDQNLTLSLPSLRLDSFSVNLLDSLAAHKKPGLTFAPEAGSERLRRVVNKNTSEEAILETAAEAFAHGWNGLKLYFMLGLPTETEDDVEAIATLIDKISSLGRRARRGRPQLRVSLSTFVPKPHTPFQWAAQEDETKLNAKIELLKHRLRRKDVRLSWNDPKVSQLEAAMSRGDRRLGGVIQRAWQLGAVFDGWSEHFNYENWRRAFKENQLEPAFYAQREIPLDEPLPWAHIDSGLTQAFLKREQKNALAGKEIPDCRHQECNVCGLQRWQPSCRQKHRLAKA